MKSFIRLKGYTLTSFSRLVGISKSTLNEIIEGKISNYDLYLHNMGKITESLNLPLTFFEEPPSLKKERWQVSNTKDCSSTTMRSELAQNLLDDLDELLSIASFYIK